MPKYVIVELDDSTALLALKVTKASVTGISQTKKEVTHYKKIAIFNTTDDALTFMEKLDA